MTVSYTHLDVYKRQLPYVRGTTKAQSISNREAVARAIDHGVPIRFDETAWSPYLRYWQYGLSLIHI